MAIEPTPGTTRALRIVREFAQPRERVWAAWTSADAIVQWLGPAEWPAVEVTADVRVGGRWRACLKSTRGAELLWQSGKYHEVNPPEKLVFSFRWEGTNHEDGPGAETLVTVMLSEISEGRTLMQFEHVGLVSDQSARGHTEGWNSTFDRLARSLGSQSVAGMTR
jgi:uncharacterized protein YndB with AHSA1/START domain